VPIVAHKFRKLAAPSSFVVTGGHIDGAIPLHRVRFTAAQQRPRHVLAEPKCLSILCFLGQLVQISDDGNSETLGHRRAPETLYNNIETPAAETHRTS
jgi:hypothetical protein